MARDIPPGNDERAVARVREELQILLGTRGDPLDAALTLRSAIERGLIDQIGNALVGNVTYINTFPTTGSGGGASTTPDMTAPPTVAGLVVTAGFSSVLVQFTAPSYTTRSGTASNQRTNIYAVKKDPSDATLPTFSAGVTPLVSAAAGTLNIVSIPSELNTRWHVWAKHLTVDGVESTVAAGGTSGYNLAGAYPTTGQDTAQLLGVLAGQITESQLFRALAEPIRSIIRRSDDAAEDALRAAVATHNAGRRAAEALLIEAQDRGTSITETRTLINAGDEQLAGTITTLTAAVATNQTVALAAVQTEENARVGAGQAEAISRQALATQMRGNYAGSDLGSITSGLLFEERAARSGATDALAIRALALEVSVDTPSTGLKSRAAALETTTTAAGSGNAALAERSLTLEASVNTPTDANNPTRAALSVEASVRASQTGPILASYSVKLDVNGYMSGYGLTSSLVAGGTPTSMFLVSVDKFAVATPASSITNWSAGQAIGVNEIRGVAGNTDKVLVCKTPGTTGGATPAIAGAIGTTLQDGGVSWQIASRVPFAVLTVPTTVNGVSLPAGVYIDAAYVLNGTIKKSQLGDAIIDDAKVIDLSAAKLLAGSLAVGADISSTGFVAGSTGWRIQGGGAAEFQSGTFRGTIFASAGSIGGNTIDATGIQSPGYTVGSTGFRFDTSGLLRAFASSGARVLDLAATGASPVLRVGSALEVLANGTATFAGNLSAAGGTFAGDLSAAGGTFSGTLTAQGVITSFLIAPNAVSLRRNAQRTSSTTLAFGGNADYMVYRQITLVALSSMAPDAASPADVYLSFVYKANVSTTAGTSGTASARVRLVRNSTTIWTSESNQSNGTFKTDSAGGLYLDQNVSGAVTYTLILEGLNEYLAGAGDTESFHTISAISATLIAIAYQR